MRALCIAALIACRSPSPGHPGTGQPGGSAAGSEAGEITPESLGLPATPEAEPPPAPTPVRQAPGYPGFYNHQACPPGRYGCVFSRTVTDERLTSRLDCPSPYSSYVGGRALRRLAITRIEVDPPDHDTADTDDTDLVLDRGQLRKPIVQNLRDIEACLRAATASVTIDLRVVINTRGLVVSSVNDASDPRCIDSLVASLRFSRAARSTAARIQLDYTVDDPSAFAKPLDCP